MMKPALLKALRVFSFLVVSNLVSFSAQLGHILRFSLYLLMFPVAYHIVR